MSKTWVPEWATHYVIEMDNVVVGLYTIQFMNEDCDDIPQYARPICEIAHNLATVDVLTQISTKNPDAPGKQDRSKPRNKYDREIIPGVYVDVYDVYDVLDAFMVKSSAVGHAIKKLLAPGQRGLKEEKQDLLEARDSIMNKLQRLDEWV